MKITLAIALVLSLFAPAGAFAQSAPQTSNPAAQNSGNSSPYGTLDNSSNFQQNDGSAPTGRSASEPDHTSPMNTSPMTTPNNDAGTDAPTQGTGH